MNDELTQEQQENLILATLRMKAHGAAERGRRYVTEAELASACRTVLNRARARQAAVSSGGAPDHSLSKMIRGMAALKHAAITPATASEDVRYVKALTTGAQPGSYLTPTVQAASIVSQLAQYNSARAAGARIWPASKIEEMRVPVGVASPTFSWVPQNAQITVSDPDYGSLVFTMRTCAALIRASAQLYRTSVPAFDVLLEDSFAFGLAEAEDVAMHAASTVANGPTALLSQAGITSINAAGGNANGGPLAFGDVTSLVEKVVTSKARLPFAFFGAGRTWLRILSLQSAASSMPMFEIGPPSNSQSYGTIFNFDYFSASCPLNEAVGSGSAQSHLVLCPPRSIHIAESGDIAMAIATQSAPEFEANQVGVRVLRETAFAFAPAGSIAVLKGIN